MSQLGDPAEVDLAERVEALAQAPAAQALLGIGTRGWIVELDEIGAAQAQVVWAGLLEIDGAVELSRVQLVAAVPPSTSDAVIVRMPGDSMAFVVFVQGGSEVLGELTESVAQDVEVTAFHPSTQLWPLPGDLLGIAPLPLVPYDLVVQFTSSGPAYALG